MIDILTSPTGFTAIFASLGIYLGIKGFIKRLKKQDQEILEKRQKQANSSES